jgi:transposase
MSRRKLTDHQWDKIKELTPGKAGDAGRTGADNRLFLDAILWMVRTGAPWRDLPELFGPWNSVWKRFSRWSKKGVWENIFRTLADDDPDLEYVAIDATIVRAHQHSAGGKGGPKIRPLVDLAVD